MLLVKSTRPARARLHAQLVTGCSHSLNAPLKALKNTRWGLSVGANERFCHAWGDSRHAHETRWRFHTWGADKRRLGHAPDSVWNLFLCHSLCHLRFTKSPVAISHPSLYFCT